MKNFYNMAKDEEIRKLSPQSARSQSHTKQSWSRLWLHRHTDTQTLQVEGQSGGCGCACAAAGSMMECPGARHRLSHSSVDGAADGKAGWEGACGPRGGPTQAHQ